MPFDFGIKLVTGNPDSIFQHLETYYYNCSFCAALWIRVFSEKGLRSAQHRFLGLCRWLPEEWVETLTSTSAERNACRVLYLTRTICVPVKMHENVGFPNCEETGSGWRRWKQDKDLTVSNSTCIKRGWSSGLTKEQNLDSLKTEIGNVCLKVNTTW